MKEKIEIDKMDELLTTLKSIDGSLKQIALKINTAPRNIGDQREKIVGDRLIDSALKRAAMGGLPLDRRW